MAATDKYITGKEVSSNCYIEIYYHSSVPSEVDGSGTMLNFLNTFGPTLFYYDYSTNTFTHESVTTVGDLLKLLNNGVKYIRVVDDSGGGTSPRNCYITEVYWTYATSSINDIMYLSIDGSASIYIPNSSSITWQFGVAPAEINNWVCLDCGNSWYATPSPNYPTICPSCDSDNITVPDLDLQCDECGTLFPSTIYGECPNCGSAMYTPVSQTGPWVCYNCDYSWWAPDGHSPDVCPRCGSDDIDYDGE